MEGMSLTPVPALNSASACLSLQKDSADGAEEAIQTAAIAPREAAEIYGLQVLESGIANDGNAETRRGSPPSAHLFSHHWTTAAPFIPKHNFNTHVVLTASSVSVTTL